MNYSIDLKERVIAFIEQGGKKLQAAHLFKVSRPTIDRWIKQKEDTGSLKTPPLAPRKWRKLCKEDLIAYVTLNPDCILADYAAHFKVSESGVLRALRRLKFTRKKRSQNIRNATKKSVRSSSVKLKP